MGSQHLVNGLETSWALAAIAWSWHFATVGSQIPLAVVCGTMPFIRPELGLWAVMLCVRDAWTRRAVTVGFIAALAAVPWLLLNWLYTGGLLPTSLAAKRDWYAEGCSSLLDRWRSIGGGLGLWLFISAGASAGLVGLWRSRLGRLALSSFLITLVLWSVGVPSLLYAYHRHRYFAPYLAFLVIGLLWLPAARRQLIAVGATAALVTTALVVINEPGRIRRISVERHEILRLLASVGAERVMLHDAGFTPWASSAGLFTDMVGLKTPLAAAQHRQLTGPSCGSRRPEALAAIARHGQVDYLLVWGVWDRTYQISAGLRSVGWQAREVGRTSGPDPTLLYHLTPPAAATGHVERAPSP
jgi:hypothetical protein